MASKQIRRIFFEPEWYIHSALWLLYFMSINVSWTSTWFSKSFLPQSVAPHMALAVPLIFYSNAFWMAPNFCNTKKWYLYIGYFALFALGGEAFRASVFALYLNGINGFPTFFVAEFLGENSMLFGPLNVLLLNAFVLSFLYWFIKDRVRNKAKIEKLESEKLKMEVKALKSQINPHFLFNNLNALDTLIDKDPEASKRYLHSLSKLYRYTLEEIEENVVPLRKELNFLEDYTYLIQQRYGEMYIFHQEVSVVDIDRYVIPPVALQGLVENAIKHNSGSMENPLHIYIRIMPDVIIVHHKKCPKQRVEGRLGKGLSSLMGRYEYLSKGPIKIIDDAVFSIHLPQIKIFSK
ncbi:sensor histidine kinase [Spongiimicrobium salis]|uniref:sensor histidine kinase n=1 Tax=Spongiimicrobium salis TaxID=1667022 RepID=UPI00374D4D11